MQWLTFESGLTIVELMISMTLGLLVVMAATALLLSSKVAYVTEDEDARLQETGRYALDVMARAVRQAAFENWDKDDAPVQTRLQYSANVIGLDARTLKESSSGIDAPLTSSINGSDVLAVRFFGIGAGEHGDGSILNCAGSAVQEPASQETAEEDRGWSIFYVAKGVGGEPELYCKYRGKKSWTTGAIATGIESFQVLYGVDTDGDGLPNAYMTATAINALDGGAGPEGAGMQATGGRGDARWQNVVAVKIALLLRGTEGSGTPAAKAQYDLFGKEYADSNAANDPGTRLAVADLPPTLRNRLRKIFTQTITVRNCVTGSRT